MKQYRPEFPNPQFERRDWMNLNGEWEFETDPGKSGDARGVQNKAHLAGKIIVPFCPESKLSGIGDIDFMECVWYRRDLEIPAEQTGKRVLLRFGAVDRVATVYVNGVCVGTHSGGFVGFAFDITDFLHEGVNSLCVRAVDEIRDPRYGHGKQSACYASAGCCYTRVTGIWQTVWLEFVPAARIKQFRLIPDIENCKLGFSVDLIGAGKLTLSASYAGKQVGKCELTATGGTVTGELLLSELHLWEVGQGRLYDLTLTYGDDTVQSYFGMRSLSFDGKKFLLNGKSVFQRLVLDQGYYPDGIYTAPSEDALIRDIQISLDAGFNGARLHQKVFEPRFLYHCDRMGYLVWGEYGNWGINPSDPAVIPRMLEEWLEILARDCNHPSIVAWCPLNEVWEKPDPFLMSTIYRTTKAVDPTRPCVDSSGGSHVVTDIYDVHDYTQDTNTFGKIWSSPDIAECLKISRDYHDYVLVNWRGAAYENQPFMLSEYGGMSFGSGGWGYGNAPQGEEEFVARYKGLTETLLQNPSMFGFCYTQLYDIEQEINGLYTYERKPKFDMTQIHQVNATKAAIED